MIPDPTPKRRGRKPAPPEVRAARLEAYRERERTRRRSGHWLPAPPEQLAAYERAVARLCALLPGAVRARSEARDVARVLELPYGSVRHLRARSLPRVLSAVEAGVAALDTPEGMARAAARLAP